MSLDIKQTTIIKHTTLSIGGPGNEGDFAVAKVVPVALWTRSFRRACTAFCWAVEYRFVQR